MALAKLQEASAKARCRLSRIFPYAVIIVAAEHATSRFHRCQFIVDTLSQSHKRIPKNIENSSIHSTEFI
jgi:hypothetical protein